MRLPCIVVQFILVASTAKVIYGTSQCGNCPPGYFVSGCKSNTTANCVQCPLDSFKLGTNSLTRCSRCTDCIGRNNIEVHKCTGTHDRTCRCKDDYWYDTGALFCSQCSTCRRGRGVVKVCGPTSDTKCQRCERGKTFSPVHSKTEPCLPCKICGKDEELIAHCTRRKDTECKPVPVKTKFKLKNKSKWPDKDKNEKTTAEPTTKTKTRATTTIASTVEVKREISTTSNTVLLEARKEDKAGAVSTLDVILYIIGAVVGVVFIVVVAVLVVKYRRKSTHPDSQSNQVSVPTEVSSPPSCKVIKEPVSVVITTPLMEGYSDKLLRDVSYSLIDELSRNLNPKGRWKTLAGKLNFSNKDIQNFDLEPTSATENLLSHWGQQKGSTVHHLYEVLKSLKWLLEAELVAKYL